MRDPDAILLRRYVIDRAAGRVASEWSRYDEELGAWVRCTELAARSAEHWRRLRRPGTLWCPVLGNRLKIAQDMALQAYFLTIPEDSWSRLANAVRSRPRHCLYRWRETGRRILNATAVHSSGEQSPPGKLTGWPRARGRGARSLIIR